MCGVGSDTVVGAGGCWGCAVVSWDSGSACGAGMDVDVDVGDSSLTIWAVASWEVGCIGGAVSAEADSGSCAGGPGSAFADVSVFAIGCTCGSVFSGGAKRGFTSPVGNVAAAASHSF